MPARLYRITWPDSGWCSVHSKDHRGARRCPDVNKVGTFMATLIQQIWVQLDDEVDRIVALTQQAAAAQDGPRTPTAVVDADDLYRAVDIAKAKARGKAEALFVLMAPVYETVDAIAEESSRRKHYRDAGQPYVSPGLSA